MSREAGAVIGRNGEVLHWHLPGDRTAGSLPDSRNLWDVFWEHRDNVLGFAHSHPGSGTPSHSHTDVTTFDAIEKALGRRLQWWITSEDRIVICCEGVDRWQSTDVTGAKFPWLEELRAHSYYG